MRPRGDALFMTMAGFSKEIEALLNPKKDPVFITVPEMSYLMVDGKGDPNTAAEYAQAIEVLYGLAYTMKFAIKKSRGEDFKVGPLEGLWWAEDMESFAAGRKDEWLWTAMIMLPDLVTRADFDSAASELKSKKDPPALSNVRLERWEEGLSAQLLYVGPYKDEGPDIARLHRFIGEQGCRLRGKHHEIYMGDPRRAAPEKLKTIIRQPAEKA